MNNKIKSIAKIINLIVTCLFLFLFLRNIDILELGRELRKINYVIIILIIAIILMQNIICSLRWKLLLMQLKKIHFKSVFSSISIGMMTNYLLPAKLGEFTRVYIIARNENISTFSTFSTIVVDRLSDLFIIFIVCVYLLLFFPFNKEIHQTVLSPIVIQNIIRLYVYILSGIFFALII
ncbi:MAG: flippase-like domain-containing protein, partial [Nitrospirae bacterium]|nr:flippase-like domain-containing protein [Nitrospirota bacterium]